MSGVATAAPAERVVAPPAVRSLLVSLLAVDARASSARYRAREKSVEVRFWQNVIWSSRTGHWEPAELRRFGIDIAALRAVAARGLALLDVGGVQDGDWTFEARDLGPDDPTPTGSRSFADAAAAFLNGYSACKADRLAFMQSGPKSWAAVEDVSAAVESIVAAASTIGTEQAVVKTVAPAWRPDWVRGYRVAARETALRAAELGRRHLGL